MVFMEGTWLVKKKICKLIHKEGDLNVGYFSILEDLRIFEKYHEQLDNKELILTLPAVDKIVRYSFMTKTLLIIFFFI